MIRGLGLLTMVALAAFTMQSRQPIDTPPGPGIPLPLAEERARRVSDLRYNLHFSIAAEPASAIRGRAAITFTLKDAAQPLALDFTPPKGVRSVRTSAKPIPYTIVPDHIVLPAESLREGRNEILIDFVAGDEAAQPQPGVPVHAVRAGARSPDRSRSSISPT